MKRLLYLALVIGFAWGCNPVSHNDQTSIADSTTRNIVLMHPTVRNIKTFLYLTENGIFPLPNDYNVIGVYHTKGSYNYAQTKEFINSEGINNIKLIEIGAELSPENLYTENSGSKQFREIFSKSEGAIFFGGPDIPPACYNKPTNLLTVIEDAHRHYLELSFLFHLLGGSQDSLFKPLLNQKPDYKVLGICLGMQSINVATGGTMVQDIPTELYGLTTLEQVLALPANQQHRNYHTNYGTDLDLIWGYFHQISIQKGTLLDSLNRFSESLPFIWSSHHQCIDKLGKGLIPVAWSLDGKIVEAVTHKSFPHVIGLQFHPEVPSIYSIEDMLGQSPFQTYRRSYIDMYPNKMGEDFHRDFWNYFGELFQ